jgi:hypothetical protein
MYTVYQHWDPLKVCIVGRSYPPDFYSWITIPHVRQLFEKIATETEEDYQNIIKKLNEFCVKVMRPELPQVCMVNDRFVPPPMTPRDTTIMIGDTFYESYSPAIKEFYQNVKDPNWPDCNTWYDFEQLPDYIKDECYNVHQLSDQPNMSAAFLSYNHIYDHIKLQGNNIKHHVKSGLINGAMISRIGQDLYFGTESYNQDVTELQPVLDKEFTSTRNHIVNTGGHSDGTYCPVCPGLIISLYDVPSYAKTFPGWEVVYLPNQSWSKVKEFTKLKQKNQGRWWIPGFEQDQDVVNVVETWLQHWTGYVEETVFDVNMLIIDPKNVMVFNYSQPVFDALNRFGITPHIVPFRHRYFWDGGIHCVTSDIHREGTKQDYFSERN